MDLCAGIKSDAKGNPDATFRDILSQPVLDCSNSVTGGCRFKMANGSCLCRDGWRWDCAKFYSVPVHENYAGKRKYIHSHVKPVHSQVTAIKPERCEVVAQRVKPARVRAVYALMGIVA